ncbi:MAG: hypothetical protein LBC79_10220 [Deltaproteobacteria bacterium]|nr:hypothetical protein [Deltaproteobacteria bacterium]
MPAGFIALSEFPMTGNEAKAFCARHGGRLPRVNGSDYLAWLEIAAETPIEGFGAQSASWPSGLPGSAYWTGTGGLAANPDHLWILINDNGRVAVFNPYPGWTHRALCVP